MVYSNKFVMAVLRSGKPQKELANGVVKIPFGEYALRFRNKNNRRALVKFFIDGEEASGNGYIINANDHIDIERWAEKAVKFKFVSLDSEDAVDFGKNGPNEDKVKGTIEARFYLEKEYPVFTNMPVPEVHHHHHHYPKPRPWYNPNPIWINHTNDSCQGPTVTCGTTNSVKPTSLRCSSNITRGAAPDMMGCCSFAPASGGLESLSAGPVQDGCTVEGSHSSQTFRTVSFEAETDYVAVKLFLQGFDVVKTDAGNSVVIGDSGEDEVIRKIRELEAENRQLEKLAEEKRIKQVNEALLRKLEEENRKLKEQLEG